MEKRNLNVDWKQYYKEHLVTMEEAAAAIEDGDVVFVAGASSIPVEFVSALHKRKNELTDVTVYSNVYTSPIDIVFDPEIRNHIKLKSIYQLPVERIGIDMGTIMPVGAGYDQFSPCLWENGVNT